MEKQLRLQQERKYDASIKINSLTRGFLCKKQNLLVILRKEKEEKRQLELKRQQKLKEEAEAKALEDARLAEIERALKEAKAIEDARLAEIERALKETARLQAIEDERLATLARLNASVVIQSYFRKYRTHNRYQLYANIRR
jgi:hypothetical protein